MSEELVSDSICRFFNAVIAVIAKHDTFTDRRKIIKLIKWFAEETKEGKYDDIIELSFMTYEEQRIFCANHGFICLEYYRRHRTACIADMSGQDTRKEPACQT